MACSRFERGLRMSKKVLVVDDESRYREIISLLLKAEDLDVVTASDGESAVAAFFRESPDLVILDIMLPDISGYEVCKRIRERSADTPVLFLSALGDEDHQIVGYKSGADDYITKPFKASVLSLKITRILDKLSKTPESMETKAAGCRISLNESAFTCSVDGELVSLTKIEFMLLKEFIQNKGTVLTRDYLLREVWGFDYPGESRVVDTMVTKLRKKLGPAAEAIKTIVKVGYKLEAD